MIFRKNDVIELKKGGIILGMMDNMTYLYEEVDLEKDDVLVFYTDGITEAMDPKDEEFGELRLMDTVKKNMEKSAEEIHRIIIEEVFKFCPIANEFDDITLIVMKIK